MPRMGSCCGGRGRCVRDGWMRGVEGCLGDVEVEGQQRIQDR